VTLLFQWLLLDNKFTYKFESDLNPGIDEMTMNYFTTSNQRWNGGSIVNIIIIMIFIIMYLLN